MPGENPEYLLWGHGYWRTTDVADSIAGGSGEGGWTATSDPRYGGGMSFTLGTWNRAGSYYSSLSAVAQAAPQEQIRRALAIVAQDRSWGEWPTTSRACGLR